MSEPPNADQSRSFIRNPGNGIMKKRRYRQQSQNHVLKGIYGITNTFKLSIIKSS